MTTPEKVVANRKNALQSTGPRTPEGKAVASKNALRHGLLSREALLPYEKTEDLESFRSRLWETIQPAGELEELLFDRLVSSAWRLRRTVVVESGLLGEVSDLFPDKGLAWNVAYEWIQAADYLPNLNRYEAALERSFYRALHELQRLQGLRAGGTLTVAAGAVVYLPDNGRDEG